jgi:hypothetical protein
MYGEAKMSMPVYNGEERGYAEKSVEIKKPDFVKIIDALRSEVNKNQQLTEQTHNVASGLRPVQSLPQEREPSPKDEPGLVNILWQEIWKLREANRLLEETYVHLKDVIGH